MLYFALLLHLPHFSKKDFLWRPHLSTSHRRRKPCPSFMGIGSAIYSYLSDRKKRVNDICTTYYCPRRNIKLLCWLCRIGLNKGFFISNSSKNSLLGEYMISLMSFQILHLWGRITSWSPESSGKHGMGREKYLPYKGRNDKNSAFSSTWNDYKLLQPLFQNAQCWTKCFFCNKKKLNQL